MSSSSPNESTASRLQRIGRQADAVPEDRQHPEDEFEDNVEVGEDPTHDDAEPAEQLDHFVELDEPEAAGEARNCANPSGSWSSQGAGASNNEPSNFSVKISFISISIIT